MGRKRVRELERERGRGERGRAHMLENTLTQGDLESGKSRDSRNIDNKLDSAEKEDVLVDDSWDPE